MNRFAYRSIKLRCEDVLENFRNATPCFMTAQIRKLLFRTNEVTRGRDSCLTRRKLLTRDLTVNNDMYNNSRYLYVHRFIVREYVYYNVLYVTHDSGSDEFLREGKRANTIMRARQEGEGRM
jgi:hypothetical protein